MFINVNDLGRVPGDLYVTIYCKFKRYRHTSGRNSSYRHWPTGKSPGAKPGQSGPDCDMAYREE